MRPKPYARGRCHVANYWTQVQILSADVARSHSIPMPGETTLLVRAVEHAALRFALASMPTDGTGFRRIAFFLQSHGHSVPLCLVGEHVADRAVRPLMELLVIGGANIQVLPYIAHISNHKRLDTLLMQCRDESTCLFVFHIGYLMFQFPQLLLLGTNEFLSATRAFLLPVDLLVQMFLELVAILSLGTQMPPIEDMRLLTIMRDGHVYLTEVNACYFLTCGSRMRLYLVGGNRFILRACPVDHHSSRKFPRPIEEERFIAFPVRQAQFPIGEFHGRAFVLDFEVPLALTRWVSIRIACLFAFPPRFEGGEKGLHTGIGGMGMQFLRGEEAHEVFGLEPEFLMPDGAPEEDERLRIQLSAFMG